MFSLDFKVKQDEILSLSQLMHYLEEMFVETKATWL